MKRDKPDRPGRSLEAAVEIAAPVEAVWKALTEARELTRWFPLEAKTTPGKGGSIWVSWGPPFEGTEEIEIWEPPRRLRTSWPWGPGGRAPAIRLAVDYRLEGKGGGTTLRLVHSGFGAGADWDEEYDSVRRGWRHELRGLRHYLERHPGADRVVAWPRVPIDVSLDEAWDRLMGPEGLRRAGSLEGLREGDRYDFLTAAGDRLAGRVLVNATPDFAGTLDSLDDGLLRVHLESCGGAREAGVWFAAWGKPRPAVDEFGARYRTLLERLFPAPGRA
jgi:uncharacterized protein YndB with AHSA1/START domain